jgi:FtsP/CotA-like multicopper oxidase with cupredoxin domain
MTGVFIIEGQYDTDLDTFYSRYTLSSGPWSIRAQPVMVLNQLMTVPNRLRSGGGPSPDFVVNGRLRPVVQMQPGEVQLWRIANTAGRSAAYFMAPVGLQWRQIAQDGVQFANQNYRISQNRPIYVAPGNRIDLLVQAPMQPITINVLIQNVMARGDLLPTPTSPNQNDPNPGTPLLSVVVSGPPVTLNGQPTQMPFIGQAPQQPRFLTDIADWELRKTHYSSKTLTFDSKGPGSAVQHTINGIQFLDNLATVPVQLGAVEEWTIKNTTNGTSGPGLIDHPFHIHINPFQIFEVFSPNSENTTDPSKPCYVDPTKPETWKPCKPFTGPFVWWDTFAIPTSVQINLPSSVCSAKVQDCPAPIQPYTSCASGTCTVNIPGYFKMRTRFVDFSGAYVLHCHILIHEDRGMMYSIEVVRQGKAPIHH